MWDYKFLAKLDFRFIPIILFLMMISLLVISSMTMPEAKSIFSSHYVTNQIQWFIVGWIVFIFFAAFDYHQYSKWAWILYFIMIISLIGLYFTHSVKSVQRWYKLPLIGISYQPSENAKIIVVICLAAFLERKEKIAESLSSAMQMLLLVGIPFLLIIKQPDLGTALVLYPIALVMAYFGKVHKKIVTIVGVGGMSGIIFVSLLFSGALSHDKMRGFFTTFLKEYQYERLNPNTYHQNASQTAIAIGGLWGYGWKKSEFSARKWLPASHTDSVFAGFAEEFGFIGVVILLSLYFGMIYLSFLVALVAKDTFGKLLSSGIAVYFAMHIIVNIAMMCGLLPISGVPLLLVTYGGSSVLTTMAALGILQSIYTRRFMF